MWKLYHVQMKCLFLRALVSSQSGPVQLWCVLVLIHVPVLQYDLSASTFSPDGRVFQVEYAMKAVENSRSAAPNPANTVPPRPTVPVRLLSIVEMVSTHKHLRLHTGTAERYTTDPDTNALATS